MLHRRILLYARAADVFGQPPEELQLDFPPRRVIHPEPGKLALLPSYMWHGTVPFKDKQSRVTVTFDTTPREDRG